MSGTFDNTNKKSTPLDNFTHLRQINLIILEEYLFLSEVLSLMLKNFGLTTIHKATSLEEAKEICEMCAAKGPYHAIDFAIVDLVPPNNYGLHFLDWVRHHPSNTLQYIPVIFTTNDARKKIILNGRDHGANEILIKPFTAYNISKKLLSIINHPRNFIRSSSYCGPTRRRKIMAYEGTEKRLTKPEDIRVVYEENVA